MSTRDQLLDAIEQFLLRHDMTATNFGKMAAQDGRIVFRLRRGSDVGTRMHDRLICFMAEFDKPERPSGAAVAA